MIITITIIIATITVAIKKKNISTKQKTKIYIQKEQDKSATEQQVSFGRSVPRWGPVNDDSATAGVGSASQAPRSRGGSWHQGISIYKLNEAT